MPPSPSGFSWQTLMKMALEEARLAFCRQEVPVGSLIIDPHGTILAKTHNRMEVLNDPTAHAEILAIRMAAEKLKNNRLLDCVLIVTLEPCLMCAGAIREARLAGVVFGAFDRVQGGITSTAEVLNIYGQGKNCWHMGGILAKECSQLLNNFFSNRR